MQKQHQTSTQLQTNIPRHSTPKTPNSQFFVTNRLARICLYFHEWLLTPNINRKYSSCFRCHFTPYAAAFHIPAGFYFRALCTLLIGLKAANGADIFCLFKRHFVVFRSNEFMYQGVGHNGFGRCSLLPWNFCYHG